jgi:ABC-2 type transport system permease protein
MSAPDGNTTIAERIATTLRKHAAFVRFGYAQARAEPAELYARVLFLFIILGVFSALWRAVGDAGANVGGDPHALVWYLALTEWILLSAPSVQFRIEDEVRRGDVAYHITRPVPYLGAHFAQSVGALARRAPVLLAGACAAAWMVDRGASVPPLAIARAVAFGTAAAVVLTEYNVIVGLGAFWLGDIAPVYWIWQKLIFVLGGLLLPLPMYPGLVVTIARATPFPAMLTGPASFVLAAPFFDARVLVLALAGWGLAAAVVATALFRRAARALQVNGG